MTCKLCGHGIPAEDLQPELNMARCRLCATVQDLDAASDPAASRVGRPRTSLRPPVKMPRKFRIEERGPFSVRWRWRGAKSFALVIPALSWNVMMLFLFSGRMGRVPPSAAVHVLVGVGLAVLAAVHLVNRTRVSLSGASLVVRSEPIPWFGNRSVPRSELVQLFVREVRHRTKNGKLHLTYDLIAKRASGKKELPLVRGLGPAQALWLEQELERRMGIVDQPVPGEVNRNVG
jgi:hypothetical protein